MHIQELARQLGATVDPAADVDITGVATIEDAGAGHVTFLANPRYEVRLRSSDASAVLVVPAFADEVPPVPLRLENPYLAFARAIQLFHAPTRPPAGVHPTAVLGADVTLGDGVSIGPFAVLGDGASIGDDTVIHAHVVVYAGVSIGNDCELHSHSSVRENVRVGSHVILQNGVVLGGDGFGFAPRGDGSYEKIIHAGTVVVEDDVEIQAHGCVDRASIGTTTIRRGVKIDNLAQVGHGCDIGADTLVCGQVGLAGSTTVGERCVLAGQAGFAGHMKIASDSIFAAQSGVSGDVPKPGIYGGAPYLTMRDWRQSVVAYAKGPATLKRVKALERKMKAWEAAHDPQA